jgi:two-component system, cell cycle response regulator DivK
MKTVLLVEDHDANRAVLKRRLERRGYVVFEAVDGAQAIQQYFAVTPNCVVMDLSMPVMSGLDALTAIREACEGEAAPCVALTAHAMDAMREKCLAAGFSAFLTKPVDFNALVESIEQLTQSPQ